MFSVHFSPFSLSSHNRDGDFRRGSLLKESEAALRLIAVYIVEATTFRSRGREWKIAFSPSSAFTRKLLFFFSRFSRLCLFSSSLTLRSSPPVFTEMINGNMFMIITFSLLSGSRSVRNSLCEPRRNPKPFRLLLAGSDEA
jgi:hypothetical protein